MTTTSDILGKAKPAAAVNTTLYTVPANTQAQANLFWCNQASTEDFFRIGLTRSGEVYGVEDFIAYDVKIPANSMLNITGICLKAGAFVTVRSTNGNCSFVLTGLEVSQ